MAEDSECLHCMTRTWCGVCNDTDLERSPTRSVESGSPRIAKLVDRIRALLALPRKSPRHCSG
ncbi:MAG: hypothetical protein ACI38P_02510, partial [Cellulosimicrobium funkei]